MYQIVSRYRLPLLALAGGVIMWAGWPPNLLFFLLFIGFVPLLFIEDHFSKNENTHRKFALFLYGYLFFVTWNALTTYWIYNATLGGAIFAILANALLMSVPFLAFHYTKKQLGEALGYFSLIVYWITFEYIHHQWELTWSWLSLGNGLARFPQIIQWYEFTGIFGGTLWILGLNVLIFRAIRRQIQIRSKLKWGPDAGLENLRKRSSIISIFKIAIIVTVPVMISFIIFYTYDPKGESVEVIVVQPNIDPYEEKFSDGSRFIPYDQQVERLIELSKQHVTSNTKFVAWPETAIPGGMDLAKMETYPQVIRIRQFLNDHPNITLVTGIDGYQFYKSHATPTSREAGPEGVWYDAFNTAIVMRAGQGIVHYHKSKLVPGVERMPYPHVFDFLGKYAIDMGGISGSLGTQAERAVFFSEDSIGVAPVICFESIFGDYVTQYINKGAEAIFVITNDGWWGKTPGFRQHLYFSSLRAIETRKDVARAANTGVSCFVDQRGIIRQATDFWVPAAVKGEIMINDHRTFYTKYGDIIGRVAVLLAILCLLLTIVSSFTSKFYFRNNRMR